jgi:Domain of Unknown Function (DUF349)
VKKNRSDAIWQRFRGGCDRFFTRYAQRHEIARGERAAAREVICAELEALAASTDTDSSDAPPAATASATLMDTVRTLRARWQQEVAQRGVEPQRAMALDQRFAAAFSAVMAKWPTVFNGTDLDPEANRQRMEALVQRVEGLDSSLGGVAAAADASLTPATRLAAMLKDALAANTIGGKVDEESRWRAAQEDLRKAQAAWSRIGPVRESDRRVLTDRFQRACRRILERAGHPGETGRTGEAGRVGRAGGPR